MPPTPVFLFGTLRDADLRGVVLGSDVSGRAARLAGEAAFVAAGGDWPVLAPAESAAEGLLVELDEGALARADYFESLFGYTRASCTLQVGDVPAAAQVWRPEQAAEHRGQPWDLAAWAERHGPLAREVARDAMALYGRYPVTETAARWPSLGARAQARLAARSMPAPTTLRHRAGQGDVEIDSRETVYAGFFSVETYRLRHRRFDGAPSGPMERTVYIAADAVTVLPYDPRRDRVLLIEQFRPGPLARGEVQCWSLEAIAGRIDAGESPETAARREAEEEAGLQMGRLVRLSGYYPTPGAMSEFIHSYLGLADLPDGSAGLGGVPGEQEDIRSHLVDFAALDGLIASGEIGNAPLLLSVLELRGRRAALRAEAGIA